MYFFFHHELHLDCKLVAVPSLCVSMRSQLNSFVVRGGGGGGVVVSGGNGANAYVPTEYRRVYKLFVSTFRSASSFFENGDLLWQPFFADRI